MTHASMIYEHYSSGHLLVKPLLESNGWGETEKTITIDYLGPIDEYHIGGRQKSEDF